MTQPAVGFGRGFPRAWLVPILAMVVVLGMAVFGYFSRSIVADLIAWWPVWIGLAIAAYLLRNRQFGPIRAPGLVPLAALLFVGLFTWGHVAGWAIMPSAAQRLVGPDDREIAEATLTASIAGQIDVSVDDGVLYRVEPIRRGGSIGVPSANEHIEGTSVDVVLQPPPEPGLYSYAGWVLAVSPGPVWGLDLDGSVTADLSTISLSRLELSGAGTIELGQASRSTPINVTGSYRLVVPSSAAAEVVGVASVPATWTITETGAISPAGADGWTITVVGEAAVSVVER